MSDSCEYREVSYDDKAKVQGCFRNRTIGAVDGINHGQPYILSLNQYIFVDTSIKSNSNSGNLGTKKYPRLPRFLILITISNSFFTQSNFNSSIFYLKRMNLGNWI